MIRKTKPGWQWAEVREGSKETRWRSVAGRGCLWGWKGQALLYRMAGGGCSFLGFPSLMLQTRSFKMIAICLHTKEALIKSKWWVSPMPFLTFRGCLSGLFWLLMMSAVLGHSLGYRHIISICTLIITWLIFSIYAPMTGWYYQSRWVKGPPSSNSTSSWHLQWLCWQLKLNSEDTGL